MSMWWMLQISSSMMPERSEELPKIAQDKGIRDLARSEGFFRLIAESAAKRDMTIKEYRLSYTRRVGGSGDTEVFFSSTG